MKDYYAVLKDTRTNLYYIEKVEATTINTCWKELTKKGYTIYKIVSKEKLIEWKNGSFAEYVDKYKYIPWGVWNAIEGYKI